MINPVLKILVKLFFRPVIYIILANFSHIFSLIYFFILPIHHQIQPLKNSILSYKLWTIHYELQIELLEMNTNIIHHELCLLNEYTKTARKWIYNMSYNTISVTKTAPKLTYMPNSPYLDQIPSQQHSSYYTPLVSPEDIATKIKTKNSQSMTLFKNKGRI